MFNDKLANYRQVDAMVDPRTFSKKVLNSIILYIQDLENTELDWAARCDSGLKAITLCQGIINNLRNDLQEEEQIIIIKITGQVIKEISKYMRGNSKDLSKELAGIRLIFKLISM